MTSDARSLSVLPEGGTPWQVAHAERVAILVDAADYFAALRSAMAAASHSIIVLGWDIDSRTPLVGRSGKPEDGLPATLLLFLETLVERTPDLDVRLLLWDYTLLYARDREPLPSLNLKWRTPPQVRVELDSRLPLGACHHQKLVVIDGNLAFCGGMDLTIRRWDTAEHKPGDPARVDPDGEGYRPFHDVQMLVDGSAARWLAEVSASRWQDATGEVIPGSEAKVQWPQDVSPDCEDIEVGIARTMPAMGAAPAVKEVLDLHLACIRSARSYIYIENQYLTCDPIVDALAEQLHSMPQLEVVIITPHAPEGWLEKRTMGAGQQRAMNRLSNGSQGARVRFLYPWVGPGRGTAVLVHAKLMIIDDTFLKVGSSNLNNRSMGVDTECDLLLRATGEAHRRQIRSVLHRLLGEHLGVGTPEIMNKLAQTGSLLKAIENGSAERGLAPLTMHAENQALAETLNLVADPEAPLQPSEFVGDMFGAAGGNRFASRRVLKLAAVATFVLLLMLAWNYTPLADFANPQAIVDKLYSVRGEWWIYPAIVAAYVVGAAVLFPVTAIIAMTGLLLGPWSGWIVAMLGSLLSGWAGHAAGVWLGGSSVRNISGRAFRAVSRALKNKGVIAVAALRMVPVAPYTVVNMAMGAAGVPARTFLAGTFIGLLPGTFVLTMLGDRLREAMRDPAPGNVLVAMLVIVLWLGLAYVLQQVVVHMRNRRRERQG